MILPWEGIECFSSVLDFSKNRKTLELQLEKEYILHLKADVEPGRYASYVHDYFAVYYPLSRFLSAPQTTDAKELMRRWETLYKSVHPEWYPYINTRVRFLLFESLADDQGKRQWKIQGVLADRLRTIPFYELREIHPCSIGKPKAAGWWPTASIHKAKALTRAFTYVRNLMHV